MFSPSRDEYGYGQYEYYPGRVRVLWYCGTRYPGTVVLVLPGTVVLLYPHTRTRYCAVHCTKLIHTVNRKVCQCMYVPVRLYFELTDER
jgi:hypothetical protein